MKEFISKIVSLDNIHQWEERDSVIKESVSQHSFKVAAIAIFLLHRMLCNNATFEKEVVMYAVLHDFDESIIKRDLAHPVKYNKLNGNKLREVINEFVNKELTESKLEFVNNFSHEVKVFVKLCDWIALMTFVSRNKNLGSREFNEEMQYCFKSLKIAQQNCFVVEKFFENYDYIYNALEEIEHEW